MIEIQQILTHNMKLGAKLAKLQIKMKTPLSPNNIIKTKKGGATMTKYKRITRRNEDGTTWVKCVCCDNVDTCDYTKDSCCQVLQDRLAELEDLIENGTLIELPLDIDILEDYAHKIFDSWNDITGAISKNRSWYYEALSVIDDIVGMVWGITSRQCETKFRELQGKQGKWETTDLCDGIFICSNCGYETELVPFANGFSYCPNCGAKMNLEAEND